MGGKIKKENGTRIRKEIEVQKQRESLLERKKDMLTLIGTTIEVGVPTVKELRATLMNGNTTMAVTLIGMLHYDHYCY